MAETLVSSTDTPEQVAAVVAWTGKMDDATSEIPATQTVDHSIGAPFMVPDEQKPDTPAADAPATEPAASEDVKTPEPKAAEAKAEPAPEPVGADGKPTKKRNDPESRIGEMTWKMREAERQAKQREADILAQLQEAQRQLAAATAQKPAAPAAPAGVDPDEPTEDQFEDFSEFVAARAEYRADKKLQARLAERDAADRERIAQEQAARTNAELATAHQARIAEAKAKYADFDAVMSSDVEFSGPIIDAIVRSPIGGDLAYYLGSHPEDCARLNALPLGPALVEFGRIAALVERTLGEPAPAAPAVVTTAEPAAPIPRMTSAPPPIKPVTGGAPPATADENLPMREFIRRQNALDRAAGRL